ncbi:MAG: hypothetical protein P8Y54_11510 [Xanthomonadales bacterium]
MQQLEISSVDLAIIGLYFAVVFAIGFHFARRTHDSNDLFLAGSTGRAFDPAPGSVWQPAMARPETATSWWQDYRTLSVALLLLTALIVLVFR